MEFKITINKHAQRSGMLFMGIMLCVSSISAFAQDKSNGCGIGWYFTKDKTILASSLRGSSNSTSPNSISMTSGTSGCAKHDIVEANKRIEHFVEANFDALRQDIALGQGEYLSTLSATFGCHWPALPGFAEAARQNYDYLFLNQDPQQAAITVDKLKHILRSDERLSQNCAGA
jgi:hypothetical protein